MILTFIAVAALLFWGVEKIQIADASKLAEGQTIKFNFVRSNRKVDGFVARFADEIVAYENVCQHIPVNLDFQDSPIFDRDGTHFICHNHGALYEPVSGLCVSGPCKGKKLKKLKIEISEGIILLSENI